jgi:hypothetical protein
MENKYWIMIKHNNNNSLINIAIYMQILIFNF